MRLKEVTFCLGDVPVKELLWCDLQKRAKRAKVVKRNGIVVGEPEVFQPL